MLATVNKYVVISPVRDEESVVETTIQAMLNQTVRPWRWVIVDDGSKDQTPQIIKRYAREHPWITVVRIESGAARQPGAGVVRAFENGFRFVADSDFEVLVKLDLDIDFAPEYFERLLAKFHADERLGIASGRYLENRKGQWFPIKMPEYHAAGACKAVRARCFREIGGFVAHRGWDTVDEIKAQSAGWRTRHFPELEFRHLKKEGSGIGLLRTAFMGGQTDYLCGSGGLFFSLKVLHRTVVGDPPLLEGLMFFLGYLKLWISRRPRLVTNSEARLYRNLLNERIRSSVRNSVRRLRSAEKV